MSALGRLDATDELVDDRIGTRTKDGRRAIEPDLPLVDHRDAIGHTEDRAQVMRPRNLST